MTVFPTEEFGSKKDPTAIFPSEKKSTCSCCFFRFGFLFVFFWKEFFLRGGNCPLFPFEAKQVTGDWAAKEKKRENKEGPFSPSPHFLPFPFLHLHRRILIPQHRLAENTGSEGRGVGIIKINVAAKRREREAVFSTSSSLPFSPSARKCPAAYKWESVCSEGGKGPEKHPPRSYSRRGMLGG